MKKLALIAMTLMFTMGVAFAQPQTMEKKEIKNDKSEIQTERVALRKLEGNEVSYQAKQNFNIDFKNAKDPMWKRVDTFDEVSFKLGNKNLKAYYDYDGKLVGTTQRETFADIPASAQKDIKEKYQGYTIGPVVFFKDNTANQTDMVLWATQFDDADNYFVEMDKGTEAIILKVDPYGMVSYFKKLS
jgi:hypothetical protein